MHISEVAAIITRIADGFEEACLKCLEENSWVVVMAVKEQLYCGVDAEGEYLSPTYDNDPFFEEEGYWYHRSQDYKAWKKAITPPRGWYETPINLIPRPDNVPNLIIDGTFYSEINAIMDGDTLRVDPGDGNGPDIVSKYGDRILGMGDESVVYFNSTALLPALEKFYSECGYR